MLDDSMQVVYEEGFGGICVLTFPVLRLALYGYGCFPLHRRMQKLYSVVITSIACLKPWNEMFCSFKDHIPASLTTLFTQFIYTGTISTGLYRRSLGGSSEKYGDPYSGENAGMEVLLVSSITNIDT